MPVSVGPTPLNRDTSTRSFSSVIPADLGAFAKETAEQLMDSTGVHACCKESNTILTKMLLMLTSVGVNTLLGVNSSDELFHRQKNCRSNETVFWLYNNQ